MTSNAVLTPVPPPGYEAEPTPEPSTMVRLIRESFAAVEGQAEEVTKYLYGMMFSLDPSLRELFPVNIETQRNRLFRALLHIVNMIDRPDDVEPFLRQLGRDHRKFGVTAQHYQTMGTAMIAAIRQHAGNAWTPAMDQAWADAYAMMSRIMVEAADADPNPAWWTGQIVEHQRLTWDLATVRVEPNEPLPYHAGQYVSVEIPQRPRLWRYLSPATAPRPDGLLEFHVRAVPDGWVSRAIVNHAQVGDTWRIGAPMGRMGVDRESGRDAVMIAGGTGVAPMRAVLEELAAWGDNPQVTAFVGGRTRDDLYQLDGLNEIAATNPWLSVIPVVEDDPAAAGAEHGTLADAVTRHGSWSAHDVLVCGSPAMIRATVSRMLVAGTPLDRIRYDPFTLD